MRQFTYAVKLTPDRADGGLIASCRDLPEAITQGENVEDALAEAQEGVKRIRAGRKHQEDLLKKQKEDELKKAGGEVPPKPAPTKGA